jgi:hypothetical protein
MRKKSDQISPIKDPCYRRLTSIAKTNGEKDGLWGLEEREMKNFVGVRRFIFLLDLDAV